MISQKNQQYLLLLEDIFDVYLACGLKTYIWGGLTLDIWEGRFIREYGDLDGFTENLEEHLGSLMKEYSDRGYCVEYIREFSMLEIRKGLVHASINPLKINGKTAEWKHIGNEGSVYFPAEWLDESPRDFYHVKAYTAGIRFEYAVKTKIAMLHPVWQLREKDRIAIGRMKEKLKAMNISEEDIYPWFWSYNPYWYKQGYDEFFRPTIASPLQPK